VSAFVQPSSRSRRSTACLSSSIREDGRGYTASTRSDQADHFGGRALQIQLPADLDRAGGLAGYRHAVVTSASPELARNWLVCLRAQGGVGLSVVCAGIIVADIFVPPLPALPRAGELLATDAFLIDTGGCAANVAADLAKQGVSVGVAGKVGADIFGDFVERDLATKAIDTRGLIRSTDLGTSSTVVLPVVGEDRRFIHTFGANADFRVSDIDLALYPGARVLYVGGYLVMPAIVPGELVSLLATARRAGIRTVLDVVVPGDDAGRSMPALETVLPEVDLFLPNDEEAQNLTGECTPVRQAERFLAAGCRAVIITQGCHGALYRDASRCVESGVYAVEVADGSGSGDAFAAGCIVGLLEGWDPRETLRYASAIGASACTRLGCTTGVYTRAEVEAYVASHDLRVSDRPMTCEAE
jgi:sugar/nucleoside kinase (ribokinase family)